MSRELTLAELETELAVELPARPLMRHHRFHQSSHNSIHNKSQQAVTIAGNNNTVNQEMTVLNLIFNNLAGTQQN
jgi:hypothetical protein